MDFSKIINIAIANKNVETITIGGQIVWAKPPVCDDFYVENISDQPCLLKAEKWGNSGNLVYKYTYDGKAYTNFNIYNGITIPPKKKLYLRGHQSGSNGTGTYNYLTANQQFNVGGRLRSLIDDGDPTIQFTYQYGLSYAFKRFLQNNKNLINADKLIFPDDLDKIINDHIYEGFFWQCPNLKHGPLVLPQKDISKNNFIYAYFAYGCTNLENAPIIKANYAYYAFQHMFDGCSKINYVEVYSRGNSGDSFNNWLANVAPTGVVKAPKNLSLPINSPNGIPKGWTRKELDVNLDRYFYVENLENKEIGIKFNQKEDKDSSFTYDAIPTLNFEYSVDKGETWQTVNSNYATSKSMMIPPHGKLYLRGDNDKAFAVTENFYFGWNELDFGGKVAIGGELLSLMSKSMADVNLNLHNYQFYKLFANNLNLIHAKNLVFPKKTALSSFAGMFGGCKNLLDICDITYDDSNVVADMAFNTLFLNCTSLKRCYIKANTLVKNCLYRTFMGCNALNDITFLTSQKLLADRNAGWQPIYTSEWVKGVAEKGTITILAGTKNDWNLIYKNNSDKHSSSFPAGWDVNEK